MHGLVDLIPKIEPDRFGNIFDPVAGHTPNVVVRFRIAIEAFDRPPDLDLLNFSNLGKHLEIPVNRAQTDAGQVLTDHVVDFIRTWMGVHFSKFSEDDPSLVGHPQESVICHVRTCYLAPSGAISQTSGPQ